MSSVTERWARLLDGEHVASVLIDIAAFLTTAAMVDDELVGPLRQLLVDHERAGGALCERDRRIAACDPDNPAAVVADASTWFAESGALTAKQAERWRQIAERRDQVARAPYHLLAEDAAPELLDAMIDLRDLLATCSRWWCVHIVMGGSVDEDVPVTSLREAVLAHIIHIAQKAARP